MKSITLLCMFFIVICNAQESYEFFGTSYNVTQSYGGPVYLNLTINTNNMVTGYMDHDPYPGQRAFCGAGELSGTINGNVLNFSYVSQDQDPGCGFDHGQTISYQCEISLNQSIITGNYTIYSKSGNYQSMGNVYLRKEKDCPNIPFLEADYTSKIGSSEESYAFQYLCLAKKTCNEFNNSGSDGWAGGFIKYMFDYMETHNFGLKGLDIECDPLEPKARCFAKAGIWHAAKELAPSFFRYCGLVETEQDIEKWSSDHEAFLQQAVESCFDELILESDSCGFDNRALCSAFLSASRWSTIQTVRFLRKSAQAYCINEMQNGNINDLRKSMPPPLSKEELFIDDLPNANKITIETDSSFLKVNNSYQLKIGSVDKKLIHQKLNNEYIFYTDADPEIASISEEGILTIKGTYFPLFNSRMPIAVYVYDREENLLGISQFAIYDEDSDEDLIVDSYESKIGLNPNSFNKLNSDSDGDYLSDFFETQIRTNPLKRDTDSDGFVDQWEVEVRTDPLDPTSSPISITLGVDDLKLSESDLTIFPNPSEGNFSLKGNVINNHTGGSVDLKIYDIRGKMIREISKATIQNDIIIIRDFSYPGGIYFVRLEINENIFIKRLVKL